MRSLGVLLLLACACLPGSGQAPPQAADPTQAAKHLLAEERWRDIVRLVDGVPARSADLDFYYGTALARLGRWQEAHLAFLAGHRLQPFDKRFPIELAGVEFKQKRYPEAAKWLRRALHLDPNDAYSNDFLGSVYFLQGNLEAALKYWNRIAKPQVESVKPEPEPRVDPALLDRAFAFSPGSTLSLPGLLTTQARIGGLGIFPSSRFDLSARDDGKFDVVFRALERNGCGRNKWEGLISFFRGVFYQTVYPEFFNLDRSATNFVSLLRWDAQKRRVMASLSGPIRQDAKWRYRMGVDLRNEDWDIRAGAAPALRLGASNLRRENVSASVISFPGAGWGWSTGVEFSHRDLRSIVPGSALAQALPLQGYQLKHVAELKYDLWRVPEKRFVVTNAVSSEIGRIWSQPDHSFSKLQGAVTARWFPQDHGDDYEVRGSLRGGKTFGQVPFDELFTLAVERDNDLWLRAHPGTSDGRKGSGPLGHSYMLSNWELDKKIYSNSFLGVKLGPFLDTGRVFDSSFQSQKWLWDTGVQAKLHLLGVELVFLYGKDLRSGRNIFYAMPQR